VEKRFLQELKRSHHNAELQSSQIGQEVVLMGWIQTRRDHGGVIFADLRDLNGITQVVFDPQIHPESHAQANALRSEFCIGVRGKVRARPEGMKNSHLVTGEIEVAVEQLEIFSSSPPPPFPIEDDAETNEMVRLEYRYLDLRRQRAKKPLLIRSQICNLIRTYLTQRQFFELETPFLTKSTPEGARDYLVPSRLYPGEAYALPQSPQIFKQLYMVAGFERYFQIVRCFRDEDLRLDRQPEFTQLDLEMSFITREEIFSLMEGLWKLVWKEVLGLEIKAPFERMTYRDAMERFGSDKPDLRIPWELKTVTSLFSQSDFKVFREASEKGLKIQVLKIPQGESLSRKDLDDLTPLGKIYGAKGIAWIKLNDPQDLEAGWQSPISKFLSAKEKKDLLEHTGATRGDVLIFCADKKKIVADSLSAIRLHLGKKLNAFQNEAWRFVWIIDFPMFQFDEKENRWVSEHHPFTGPQEAYRDNFHLKPEEALADCYDLVLNGMEMGSGSIRIHQSETQKRVFELLKLSEEEMQLKFGFLLKALQYGAPPHGGVAFGIDRFAMILSGGESLRDVIAFPKTQKGQCLMTQAPSYIPPEQWSELSLKVLERPRGESKG
jgi:aspartyl-tRNA synthetase